MVNKDTHFLLKRINTETLCGKNPKGVKCVNHVKNVTCMDCLTILEIQTRNRTNRLNEQWGGK